MRVNQHSGSQFGAGVVWGALLLAMGWGALWVYENVGAVDAATEWLLRPIFSIMDVLVVVLLLACILLLMAYGPRRVT
jgi:hypothetical protein